MSAQPIYEVRQRAVTNPLLSRTIAYVTDVTMAKQLIDACYRRVWGEVNTSSFLPSEWVDASLRQHIVSVGLDRWWADDLNTEAPLFYSEKHSLWNQVPASVFESNFTKESYS